MLRDMGGNEGTAKYYFKNIFLELLFLTYTIIFWAKMRIKIGFMAIQSKINENKNELYFNIENKYTS